MNSLPIRYVVNINGEWFSNFSPEDKNKGIAEYCRYPRIKELTLKKSADNIKSGKNIYFDTSISIINADGKYDLIANDYDGASVTIYRTDKNIEPSELSDLILVFSGNVNEFKITDNTFKLVCLDSRDKDTLMDIKSGKKLWFIGHNSSFNDYNVISDDKPDSPVEPGFIRYTDINPYTIDPFGIGSYYSQWQGFNTYYDYLGGAPWKTALPIGRDSSGSIPSLSGTVPKENGGGSWYSLNLVTGDIMVQADDNGAASFTGTEMRGMQVGTDDSYNLVLMDSVILHLNKALGITYDATNYDLTTWNTWRTYFRDENCYFMAGYYDTSYSCMEEVENILTSLNLSLFVDNNGLLSLHEFGEGYIRHIIKNSDVFNNPDVVYNKDLYTYSINIVGEFGNTNYSLTSFTGDGRTLTRTPWAYNLTNASYNFSASYFTQENRTNAIKAKKVALNSVVIPDLSSNTINLRLPYVNQIDFKENINDAGFYAPEDFQWFRIQNRLDYFNWIPATIEIKVKSIEGFQLYDLVEYDLDRVDDTSWLIIGIDYDTNVVKLKKEKESLVLGYDLIDGSLTPNTRDEGIVFVDPSLDREA